MAEPTIDRRETILAAALKVFSKEGFEKATIKKIAAEAELRSPALIYWYFKNKKELLEAVIFRFTPVAEQIRNLEVLAEQPPDEVLRLVASVFTERFEAPRLIQLLRVVVSEAARRPGIIDRFAEEGILRAIRALADYLQHQVDLERLRPHDTLACARVFMASLITYVIWKEVLPPLGKNLPPKEKYFDTVLGLFLDGLRVKP